MNDLYTEIENFIPPELCNDIIHRIDHKLYDSCIKIVKKFKKQYRIKFIDTYLQNILKQIFVNKSFDFNICESFTYVDYEETGHVHTHLDDIMGKYTMIIYLNDDYENGQTYVVLNDETITIEKKVGKVLIFEGNKVPHGSFKVKGGHKRILLCKLY